VTDRRRAAPLAIALLAMALPAAAAAQPGGTPDNVIDARVRASAEAAQGYQGQLDGAWTLTDAAGRPIYDFQLVERAGGRGELQGVFRDLRAAATPGDIGFVDSLERNGAQLNLSFHPAAGGAAVSVALSGGADGDWAGDLREGAAVTHVKLRRSLDF
jgi:hypothetical protein